MKRAAAMLLCMLLMAGVLFTSAGADMGPKPSVVVDFEGLEGEAYYVTLLSKAESTGPYSALKASDRDWARQREEDEGYGIFLKFAGYADPDGYHFLQYFQDCTESQCFQWTYYPPRDFKILLYFPGTDRFLSGPGLERYAFDSYFTAAVEGDTVIARQSYRYGGELASLAVRTALTLAVELALALAFGFRERRQFRFIVLVNVATQAALNLALNVIHYYSGLLAFLAFYILLELAVFIVEALLYKACLPKRSAAPAPGWKYTAYALAANAASFVLGIKLAQWIPGIF